MEGSRCGVHHSFVGRNRVLWRVACVQQGLWTSYWSLERRRKSGVGERGLRLKYNKLSYMERSVVFIYPFNVSHGVAAYDEIVR